MGAGVVVSPTFALPFQLHALRRLGPYGDAAGRQIDGDDHAARLLALQYVALLLETAVEQLLFQQGGHLLGRQDFEQLELRANAVVSTQDSLQALAHPDAISSTHDSPLTPTPRPRSG